MSQHQSSGSDQSSANQGDIYTGIQFVSVGALIVAITLLVLAVSAYQS